MVLEIEERLIPVRDTVLNVALSGEGPAVVLLHGFPHTWRVWTPLVEPLSRAHRVVAPDLRGLGASDAGPSGYDAGQVAADVVPGALARALEHYRAMPTSSAQLSEAAHRRLRVPTLTIGAQPVGEALHHQLAPITDDLTGHLIEDCGHIIAQDRPEALIRRMLPFLS